MKTEPYCVTELFEIRDFFCLKITELEHSLFTGSNKFVIYLLNVFDQGNVKGTRFSMTGVHKIDGDAGGGIAKVIPTVHRCVENPEWTSDSRLRASATETQRAI